MKRVIVVHGWSGNPNKEWFPWIKKELQKRGFSVKVPKMPDTNHPKIKPWVNFLKKQVGKPDKNTYFVGHSIGCQTILRYLQNIDGKVGGTVFIAGWFKLKNLDMPEERQIAKPWVKTPINFNKIKQHTKRFTAIFSDNDPYVPLSNVKLFKRKLGAKTIIMKGKRHFGQDGNITKVPYVVKELLKITK